MKKVRDLTPTFPTQEIVPGSSDQKRAEYLRQLTTPIRFIHKIGISPIIEACNIKRNIETDF